MELRGRPQDSDAYRFSTVLPGLRPSRKGGRKSARLEKLVFRRANRAASVAASDDSVRLEWFSHIAVPQQGSDDPATTAASLQGAQEPAPSEEQPAPSEEQPAALEEEAGSEVGSSDAEWPIKGILAEDVDSDGELVYQVEWVGNFDPSWVSEYDVNEEALDVWQTSKAAATSSKKRKRGPGRPRGNKKKR